MRLIIDYEPDSEDFIVRIDSKSKYKDSIVGVGKSIEDSIGNMILTFEIFLKCYKVRDDLYKALDKWFDELRLVAKVKLKLTKRLTDNIKPMIRFKVTNELIYKIHGGL